MRGIESIEFVESIELIERVVFMLEPCAVNREPFLCSPSNTTRRA